MDGWTAGGLLYEGRRGNPFGSLPCVIKRKKSLLQEMGAAERSRVHEAGERQRWMDGWTMTGCHSVRMMMPDLQGDAAGTLGYLSRLLTGSLFRGESEEGMPWEILFPIPHPSSMPMPCAKAQQQTARCAVMMTWGGVDDGIDVLGLALFAGGPCSCCRVR